MNSTISDDLTRDHLALEAAKCIESIFTNNKNVRSLHKELLEVNLSISAFITESKRRLKNLRLELAYEAKSSQRVVEILSEK